MKDIFFTTLIWLSLCIILSFFYAKYLFKEKPVKQPAYKVYYEYDVIYYTHHRITTINGIYTESSDIILGIDTIPIDTVYIPIN
jgi:hypothetical protein